MSTFSRIKVTLGLDLVLIVALMVIVVALVTYTATVTINPAQQFTVGSTSGSWTIFVNEIDSTRYLPGGLVEPTLDAGDTSTYAFSVATDAPKV